jgi:LNS2 (Lipin/Ned1/Smp2)
MIEIVRGLWLAIVLAACGARAHGAEPYATHANVEIATRTGGIDDLRCGGVPAARRQGFRHVTSRIAAALGSPLHRGTDLIAAVGDDQVIAGALGYSLADKALEDEDVELYACDRQGWRRLGTTRTDGDGHFALRLDAAARLPIGMRDLYASVAGDRSGVRFLAYVAPVGTRVIVSDVDGTLTASENAFPEAVVFDTRVDAQPGAAAAFQAATAAGYQLVYVTARGDRFTGATRHWLADHGFPRGPLRLASGLLVWPGAATVAFKSHVLQALARHLVIVAGVGNRESDIEAYTAAGVAANRIFVKLPEFASELAHAIHANRAVGLASYRDLAL